MKPRFRAEWEVLSDGLTIYKDVISLNGKQGARYLPLSEN